MSTVSLFVDLNFDDNDPDLGNTKFKTVQDAVNKAKGMLYDENNPGAVKDDVTINVAAGVYDEVVLFSNANNSSARLTLNGLDGTDKAEIRGIQFADPSSAVNGWATRFNQNITIDSFAIVGTDATRNLITTMLAGDGLDGLIISNNDLSGYGDMAAMYFDGSTSAVEISGNTIDGTNIGAPGYGGHGIRWDGAGSVSIIDNDFENINYHGISLQNYVGDTGNTIDISGNTMDNVARNGIQFGDWRAADSNTQFVVTGNDISTIGNDGNDGAIKFHPNIVGGTANANWDISGNTLFSENGGSLTFLNNTVIPVNTIDITGNTLESGVNNFSAGPVALDGDVTAIINSGTTVNGYTGATDTDVSGNVSIELNGTANSNSIIQGLNGGSAGSVSITINGIVGDGSTISFGTGTVTGDGVFSFNGTIGDNVIIDGNGVGGTSILELGDGTSGGTFQGFTEVYFQNTGALDFGTINTTGTGTEFFFDPNYDFSQLSGTLTGFGVVTVDDSVVQDLRDALDVGGGIIFNGSIGNYDGDQSHIIFIDNTLATATSGTITASADLLIENFSVNSSFGSPVDVQGATTIENAAGSFLGFANGLYSVGDISITNGVGGSISGNNGPLGGSDLISDGIISIVNDGHMALNVKGNEVIISSNTSLNTLAGKIDGVSIQVTTNTGSINADFGSSTTDLIMLTNNTDGAQAGIVDGCTFTVDASQGTILFTNRGGVISDTAFVGHTIVLQGTEATITGDLEFTGTSIVFGDTLVATLDNAVISFSGLFQNMGTISVDAAQFSESLVLLIDNKGSGVGKYGNVVFSGEDLGYRFVEVSGDLYATDIAMDMLYLDSSWTTQGFLEPVSLANGGTAYYGFNAYSDLGAVITASATTGVTSIGVNADSVSQWPMYDNRVDAIANSLTKDLAFVSVDGNAVSLISEEWTAPEGYSSIKSNLTIGEGVTLNLTPVMSVSMVGGILLMDNAAKDITLQVDGTLVTGGGEYGSDATGATNKVIVDVTDTGKFISGDVSFLTNSELNVTGTGTATTKMTDIQFAAVNVDLGGLVDMVGTNVAILGTVALSGIEAMTVTDSVFSAGMANSNKEVTFTDSDAMITTLSIQSNEFNVSGGTLQGNFTEIALGAELNIDGSLVQITSVNNNGTINITGDSTVVGNLSGTGVANLQNAHLGTTNAIDTNITGSSLMMVTGGVNSITDAQITSAIFGVADADLTLDNSNISAEFVVLGDSNSNLVMDVDSLITASSAFANLGAITLALTVDQSNEFFVTKMVDVTATTDFGSLFLQVGSDAPVTSENFVVRDFDLWFNNSDMTTVFVNNVDYVGYLTGEEIGTDTGIFYNFNAYLEYDATVVPTTSAVEFTGGNYTADMAFVDRVFSINGLVTFANVTGGEVEMVTDAVMTNVTLTIDATSTDALMVFTGTGIADVTDLILTGGAALTGRGKYLISEGWRDDVFDITLDGVSYTLGIAYDGKKFTLEGENLYLQYSNDQFNYRGTTPILTNSFAFVGRDLSNSLYDEVLNSRELPAVTIDNSSAPIDPGARIYGGHLIDGDVYISGHFVTSLAITEDVSVTGGVVGGSRMEPTYDGATTVSMRTNIAIETTGDVGFVVGGNQVMGGNVSTNGDKYVIQIDGGNFTNWICGGSVASGDAYVAAFGAQTQIVINDGTFAKAIYGGGFSQNGGELDFYGKTNITINGGEFFGNIYGGHGASGAMQDGTAWIYGDTNITINGGTFHGSIFAGSYDNGRISGTTTLTFTGSNFVVEGRVEGDSSNAGYWDKSYVGSDRILIFDNVSNNFGASSIDNFDVVEFKNSQVALTGQDIDFSDIVEWSFDFGSELTGFASNDLTDDTLNLTGWQNQIGSNEWTVMSGTGYVGFDQMDVIGDLQFTWDAAGYYLASSGSDTFKLSLDGDDMKLAKLA